MLPYTEASYGYIKLVGQQAEPWRLDRQLYGLFWVTLFGPDYVEMIGETRFENLNVFSVDILDDGSRLVRVTEWLEDTITPAGIRIRDEAVRELGLSWFFPAEMPGWFPRLRNLVLPK